MRPQTTAIKHLAIRDVVTVGPETTLARCAEIMRAEHVGSVVVVDESTRQPRGVVTDRDIVVEAVAVKLDPETLTAGDVMAAPLAVVREDEDFIDALARMREHGVRRLPVVDGGGRLAGIVAIDNLLEALAEQLDAVVRAVKAEQTKEAAVQR